METGSSEVKLGELHWHGIVDFYTLYFNSHHSTAALHIDHAV